MASNKVAQRPAFKVGGKPADIAAMFQTFKDKYAGDIVAFVEEFLGRNPTRAQRRMLKMVVIRDRKTKMIKYRRIARATGHSVGKSTAVTWICLHQILFEKDIRIMLLASQEEQARQTLFDQILGFADRKDTPEEELKSNFLKCMLKFTNKDIVPWDNPNKSSISVKSPSRANTQSIAGIRGDGKTLIICDEASLIDDEVYAAIGGVMGTPSTQTILTGNPLYAYGFFYQVFNEWADIWDCEHWNSEHYTTRYCIEHRLPLNERLVDDKQLEIWRRSYSESVYQARVLGQFPMDATASLVSPQCLDKSRELTLSTEGAIVWGFDLSGDGSDSSVLAIRKGQVIEDVVAVPNGQTNSMWLWRYWNDTPKSQRPDAIFYDLTGVGQGFREAIKNIPGGSDLPIRGVNLGGIDLLTEADKFVANKAEIYWRFKKLMEEEEVSFSKEIDKKIWEDIRQQALAHEFYVNDRGKTAMIKKEIIRRRLKGRSPDHLDAVCFCFSRANVHKRDVAYSKKLKERVWVARY